MKNLYLLSILVYLSLPYASFCQSTQDLFSQPGQTFIIDIIDDIGQVSDGSYYYMGDTVHQDTTFLVYESKDTAPFYLRIDDFKVYLASLEDYKDILLFDFGMEVGDTMLIHFDYKYVLESKNIIQLSDGLDRIEMNFVRPDYSNWKVKIIEGVGFEKHGLFRSMYSFVKLLCLTTDSHNLILREDFTLEECERRSCPGIKASFGLEGDRENIELVNYSLHYDSISLTFGDGEYYDEFLDSYTYSETGCYKIELEVFNECGDRSSNSAFHDYCDDPGWIKLSDFNPRKIQFLDEDVGYAISSKEAFKTTDGGRNWTLISFTPPYQNYRPNSIFFADAQYGIATSSNNEVSFSIMITADGGLSWTGAYDEDHNFTQAIIDSQGNLFAITYSGYVYRSKDQGSNWQKLDILKPWLNSDFQLLDNDVLIIANQKLMDYGLQSYLYISSDNGDTWQEIDMGFDDKITSVYFFDEFHGLVGMKSDLYETFDRGLTWQNVYTIKESGLMGNLSFSDIDNGIMTINNRYYITADGGQNWEVEYCSNTSIIRDVQIVENEIYSAHANGFYKRMSNPDFDCDDLNSLTTTYDIQLEITPNLTTGYFNILCDKKDIFYLEIRDINGNLVHQSKASSKDVIDVLSVPSGIYFATLKNQAVFKTFKIVKI